MIRFAVENTFTKAISPVIAEHGAIDACLRYKVNNDDKKELLTEAFKDRKSVLRDRGIVLNTKMLFSMYSIE
jgi:hypothetical protein